jgi:CheY-like chemotaxis protein
VIPKIVICDDHPHVRRVLQMKLEASGFEVRLATTGREALAAIREVVPQVLITDLTMPEMGGRELCTVLHATGLLPPLRVLVVTSRADRESRDWVATLPGVTLLEKPLSPKQVRDWVLEQVGSAPEVSG